MPNDNRLSEIPPKSKRSILSIRNMAIILKEKVLNIGFTLSGKSRTDGNSFRKIVTESLGLIPGGGSKENKGNPKLMAELTDVQLITKGDKRDSFNFQVWNRFPSSERIIAYSNDGEEILGNEIRYIFGFHDESVNKITSIGIFFGKDIEEQLRKTPFSIKTTVKEQLIISEKFRSDAKKLFSQKQAIITQDKINVSQLSPDEILEKLRKQHLSFKEPPSRNELIYSIQGIVGLILPEIEKFKNPTTQTKISGQNLERFIINSLGYAIKDDELLEGYFPDLRHQLLEIKIQQSPTIDLGKYSPAIKSEIEGLKEYTTEDIRYLILLTDHNGIPEGLACMSGKEIIKDKRLSFVPQKSWKCQNSFPLEIFKVNKNKVIFFENGKLISI